MGKSRSMILAGLAISSWHWSSVASAQDATVTEPKEPETVIVVTAAGRTFPAKGDELRAAQRAFRKHKERYAPHAELVLQLSSPTMASGALRDLELWLVSDDRRVPLVLNEELQFELPEIDEGDWRIATRKRGLRLAVSPWVFSPGSQMGDWRLGDLLLQCRVSLAVMKTTMNFLKSAMFDAAGGCNSRRTAVWQSVPDKVERGFVSEGEREAPLQTSGRAFKLPTDLREFSNEARARVYFANLDSSSTGLPDVERRPD